MYSTAAVSPYSSATAFAEYLQQRGHTRLADCMRRRLPINGVRRSPQNAQDAEMVRQFQQELRRMDDEMIRQFKEEVKRIEREDEARAMRQKIQAARAW